MKRKISSLAVAKLDIYGNGNWCCVLCSDGVTERAIFVIDKNGIIRYNCVHNINQSPPLEVLVRELKKLN
jgi:alkyl hydroperoxide reductase subunit AhpC